MSTETTPDLSPIDRAIKACGGVAALAEKVGVAASAPSMWKSRGRIPSDHCAAIERATDEKVKRWDLRPDDWHRIWPELIGADGAPAVPTAETTEASR